MCSGSGSPFAHHHPCCSSHSSVWARWQQKKGAMPWQQCNCLRTFEYLGGLGFLGFVVVHLQVVPLWRELDVELAGHRNRGCVFLEFMALLGQSRTSWRQDDFQSVMIWWSPGGVSGFRGGVSECDFVCCGLTRRWCSVWLMSLTQLMLFGYCIFSSNTLWNCPLIETKHLQLFILLTS